MNGLKKARVKPYKDLLFGYILCIIFFAVVIFSVLSCLSDWLGYKNLFHVILPAKIQGLNGVKLDKPFTNKAALKNGNQYNLFCGNTLFKNLYARVINRKGEDYVISIHAESTRKISYILSLLENKYGKPTQNKDSYIFSDWRSWNLIVVRPSPLDSDQFGTKAPETLRQSNPTLQSLPILEPEESWQEKNKVFTVRIDVYGQLWHENERPYELLDEEGRRKHDLNSL
ncbi:MAG: hypothetical protein II649_04770 [Kiritimatiellae bacterium]|nr:hypothetical protein [Kiritimatiellia bacterium]